MRRIRKMQEPEHFRLWKEAFRITEGRHPLYGDLRNSGEYRKLRNSLLTEQGYICCYCERAIGRKADVDCNIEHFMPRNPDRRALTAEECDQCQNAQMDYGNLLASCLGEQAYSDDHCNHKKDNWFDFNLCVSPVDAGIETLFGFRLNGKIFAIGSDVRAEAMKTHLNLDSYVLNEQRKAAYDQMMELEFEDEELLADQEYIMETIAFYDQMDHEGRYTPFCSMIIYCLRHELLD